MHNLLREVDGVVHNDKILKQCSVKVNQIQTTCTCVFINATVKVSLQFQIFN